MELLVVLVQVTFLSTVDAVYIAHGPGYLTEDIPSTSNTCPLNCSCDNVTKEISCDVYGTFSLEDISEDWTVTELSVFGNISLLPFSLSSQLENMTTLKLTHTEVNTIWEFSFKNLVNLKTLDLSSNKICTVQENSLLSVRSLIHLNLNHNDITALSSKTFSQLISLLTLDLSYNRLKYFHMETFTTLKKLEVLDLSHNQIRYLKDGIFDSLSQLNTLLLSHNNLVRLSTTVIKPLQNLQVLTLANNDWECSCALENLVTYVQYNHRHLLLDKDEIRCSHPSQWEGKLLHNIRLQDLPCFAPNISHISQDQRIPIRNEMMITCATTVYPHAFKYWITPWGQALAHDLGNVDWKARNISVKPRREYFGLSGLMEANSVLYMDEDDTLHIENFRGWFSGRYTCVAFNRGGESNSTINVYAYTAIPSTWKLSCIYSAGGPALMLLIALIVTLLKMCRRCVRSCCRREGKELEGIKGIETGEDEESKTSTLDSCRNYSDNFDNDSMPKSPIGSPWGRTPRASPKKCTTPTTEPTEGWLTSNIIETLDEVKLRLDRKMEKVRKNVQSIKESGSQYITTIKDTGSQAANRVRAGMVLGVEQVKFGVQSIKEFCGTGDMSTQTISMISVSTDVDTAEKTQVVKSVTYV